MEPDKIWDNDMYGVYICTFCDLKSFLHYGSVNDLTVLDLSNSRFGKSAMVQNKTKKQKTEDFKIMLINEKESYRVGETTIRQKDYGKKTK